MKSDLVKPLNKQIHRIHRKTGSHHVKSRDTEMLLENLAAQLENNKTVLTSRYPSPKQNRKYSYSHKTIERQHDRILSNIEGKKD